MNKKIFGDKKRVTCPVCNSGNIENIWKIPYKHLKEIVEIEKHKLQLISSFDYRTIYHFSICNNCNSVFLDPYNSKVWTSNKFVDYVKKAKERTEWKNYGWRIDRVLPFIQHFGLIVDVACGGGQNLLIFKEREIKWEREVAIEVSQPCVEYLKSLGYEAYCRKAEDDFPEIKNGSADCVLFCEAFEHVESPFIAIKNMFNWLKRGGVLYLSAQAREGDMFITPGESIATNFEALKNLFDKFGMDTVFKLFSSGKWIVIGKKR